MKIIFKKLNNVKSHSMISGKLRKTRFFFTILPQKRGGVRIYVIFKESLPKQFWSNSCTKWVKKSGYKVITVNILYSMNNKPSKTDFLQWKIADREYKTCKNAG